MDLGFAVPVSGSWATRDTIVEVAGRAEQLGYSSLWTFQRLLVPVDADDQPQLPRSTGPSTIPWPCSPSSRGRPPGAASVSPS